MVAHQFKHIPHRQWSVAILVLRAESSPRQGLSDDDWQKLREGYGPGKAQGGNPYLVHATHRTRHGLSMGSALIIELMAMLLYVWEGDYNGWAMISNVRYGLSHLLELIFNKRFSKTENGTEKGGTWFQRVGLNGSHSLLSTTTLNASLIDDAPSIPKKWPLFGENRPPAPIELNFKPPVVGQALAKRIRRSHQTTEGHCQGRPRNRSSVCLRFGETSIPMQIQQPVVKNFTGGKPHRMARPAARLSGGCKLISKLYKRCKKPLTGACHPQGSKVWRKTAARGEHGRNKQSSNQDGAQIVAICACHQLSGFRETSGDDAPCGAWAQRRGYLEVFAARLREVTETCIASHLDDRNTQDPTFSNSFVSQRTFEPSVGFKSILTNDNVSTPSGGHGQPGSISGHSAVNLQGVVDAEVLASDQLVQLLQGNPSIEASPVSISGKTSGGLLGVLVRPLYN
ncbi:hypothetical protein BKA70DRAFT_1220672 [Coprinopsis sp. MPI-PUGE-AT-0042]|nr:hypothetical protein BKA70DRAFT_1220672 [Coprinopsis sp. MPI-PUGE-AT-0042]